MNPNWSGYNNKLVNRGEFYLLADFIDYWNEELEEMNKSNRGSPFRFPQFFMDLAAFLKIVFNQPYRQLKGIIMRSSIDISGLNSADCTTLWRKARATKFELEQFTVTESEPEEEPEGVIVSVDARGMKVTNRKEWMREE